MPKSIVARERTLDEWTLRIQNRVRRLEITKNLPLAGTAIYTENYSIGSGTTWTPDFSGAAPSQEDQIGLTVTSTGVLAPAGWVVWACCVLTVSCVDPYMGEAIQWGVTVGQGPVLSRADVLLNGSQVLAGEVSAWAGWANDPLNIDFDELKSTFGSDFTPHEAAIIAGGIQLQFGGWPPGGIT